MSAATMARMETIHERMRSMMGDLDEMMASMTPVDPAKQAAFAAAFQENMLAMARANGVPLG